MKNESVNRIKGLMENEKYIEKRSTLLASITCIGVFMSWDGGVNYRQKLY